MRNHTKYKIFAAICYAIPTIFSTIQFIAIARQGLLGDPFAALLGISGIALDLIITLMIISSRKSISLAIALSTRALIAIANPAANILIHLLQIRENLPVILSSLIYAAVLVMLGLLVIAYASSNHSLCSKKTVLTRIFTVIFVIHCISVATDFIRLLTSVSLATSLLSLFIMSVMEVLRVMRLIFLYKWIAAYGITEPNSKKSYSTEISETIPIFTETPVTTPTPETIVEIEEEPSYSSKGI